MHFYILKLRFPSIILLVLMILYLRNMYIFRSQITICMIHNITNAVPCYYLWYGVIIYKRQYTDKKLTLRKSMNMRASLDFFFAFSHSKTAISFNILLVLLILYLRNCRNIYIFRSQITICMIHIHVSSLQSPVITYGMALYRQNTDVEKIYEYASERA